MEQTIKTRRAYSKKPAGDSWIDVKKLGMSNVFEN